ncbi:hypothetical protein BN159_0923 [Streptomyces davaonensis JCM 4913]|uniref:Uncharacterized protein n=1 Tax=Streptomyces davaonensis (strain DSM 101723 / JCM 4913 / KCC S-0913 / 768) TaxID=1214101 RepID=K4QWK9_STRDJ|nr:hypothetical protein BN159_0923 [Streptomyces davaonensis JCM 4913]
MRADVRFCEGWEKKERCTTLGTDRTVCHPAGQDESGGSRRRTGYPGDTADRIPLSFPARAHRWETKVVGGPRCILP